MKVSIIIPAYNEQAVLPLLRERLTAAIAGVGQACRAGPGGERAAAQFEILVVDDHSSDATAELLEAWAAADPRVRGLRLARNSGSHAALAAGLAACTGDCAILLAADLQDPPELIPALLREWRDGFDVVWAARADEAWRRGGGARTKQVSVGAWLTRLAARLYWRVMRAAALRETPAHGADVVLLDRRVIAAVGAIREKNTSLISLLLWLGFRQTRIEYAKAARAAGASKWTFAKRAKLAIDSLVSFSTLPIRATWLSGLVFLAAAAGWLLLVIAGRLGGWGPVGGGEALIVTVLLAGFGAVLTCLGGIGEYIWRAYDEVRGRPRYVIERDLTGTSRFAAEPGDGAGERGAGLDGRMRRSHAGAGRGVC